VDFSAAKKIRIKKLAEEASRTFTSLMTKLIKAYVKGRKASKDEFIAVVIYPESQSSRVAFSLRVVTAHPTNEIALLAAGFNISANSSSMFGRATRISHSVRKS
jgi:hypothetical protein